MKNLSLIIPMLFIILIGCNMPSAEEIAQKEMIKATQIAIEDSILKANEAAEQSKWVLKTYVDEFGDPTKDKYIKK